MRDHARWQPEWFLFVLTLFLGALVMSLVFFLLFLEFDLETSPAWQLGVHCLMLSLLLSITFVVALQRSFCFGERYRMVMLVPAVLTPAAVFAGVWMLGGFYSEFRDPRLFQATMVSVFSFGLL